MKNSPLMMLALAAGAVWMMMLRPAGASISSSPDDAGAGSPLEKPDTPFGGQARVVTRAWETDARRADIINAVQGWATTLGLDPRWIAAHCKVESAWNPDAVNPADPSYGLMQITPLIAKAYGKWDGRDVASIKLLDINVRAGATFLKHLLSRYGNVEAAIQAYNLGETKFNQGARVPDYLAKVRAAYRTYGGSI